LDDGSEFEELVWMGLEIESVEKALLIGVGPLTKLTLLEAESKSLVQLQLKICSFCNEKWGKGEEIGKKTYELLQIYFFCGLKWVSCGLVVKNDLPAGENAAGRWKIEQ
jgi:hypothetical protein